MVFSRGSSFLSVDDLAATVEVDSLFPKMLALENDQKGRLSRTRGYEAALDTRADYNTVFHIDRSFARSYFPRCHIVTNLAKMVTHTSQLPTAKGLSRLRTSGIKIKTHVQDAAASSGRGKALASADWRKTASATSSSSSGGSMCSGGLRRSQNDSRTSDDHTPSIEMERMHSDPNPCAHDMMQDSGSSWEMVASKPHMGSSQSSLSAFELSLAEVTAVQLKDMKPVVMNVNGEELSLPNRFTIDVTPIETKQVSFGKRSPGLVIGELKRVKNPNNLRRKSSHSAGLFDLPDDIRAMLEHDLSRPSEAKSSSANFPARKLSSSHAKSRESGDETQFRGSNHSVDNVRGREAGSEHDRAGIAKHEEDARFRNLLCRLQKIPDPGSDTQRQAPSAFDIRTSDPAIVAAKVKDEVQKIVGVMPNRAAADRLSQQQQTIWESSMEREGSGDSGYSSAHGLLLLGDTLGNSSTSTSTDTKRLNPAAAEFKSTFPTATMPVLSPRRLSRPPLSNLFLDAMPHTTPTSGVPPHMRPSPELNQALREMASRRLLSLGLDNMSSGGSEHMFPASLRGTMPTAPPGFGVSEMGTFAGMPCTLPPLNFHRQQATDTLSAPAAVFPSPPLPTAPIADPMTLPVVTGTSTFPPPGAAMPQFIPPLATGGLPHVASATAPFARPPVAAAGPQQPLFNANGKINRPHFPVTQKPRDHDPVKQQQYEAYLEWRKANEPGYHMRCKMRQANRVVRQYQQQKPDKGESAAAWKTIVEKAKAAVGAAAAVAAEEKKSRADTVREELKAKVQKCKSASEDTAATPTEWGGANGERKTQSEE
ncbi:hypothetical protein B0T22DRAFT_442650 [Podospora appendiculata]|uniref:Uncharacterized protein n=1 Tax=Podospora appendiculata TaxID=314037 RepID=A0AAE0X5Q9_9PEZI|nr:hypothetical protein B0T22DRAFT_442650 [Podospora appendiculata]